MQGFLPVGGNSLTLNALGYKVPVRRLPPDVEKWLSSKPKAAARFRATGCGSRGAQAWHLLTVVLVAGLGALGVGMRGYQRCHTLVLRLDRPCHLLSSSSALVSHGHRLRQHRKDWTLNFGGMGGGG
jgi:hypothetical protein